MRKKILWLCSLLCIVCMMSGCQIESVEEHHQSAIVIDGQSDVQKSEEREKAITDVDQEAHDDKEVQEETDEQASANKEEAQATTDEASPSVQIPQENHTSGRQSYVTISIEALSVLDHMDQLSENKRPYVPDDGYILSPTKVALQEGDSAFSILERITRSHRIHMEFQRSANNVYIQGINQLYEFDCGNLSGWMYSVNDAYVSVGADARILVDGDVVKWQYTCDSGRDLHLK